jgi:hypothetical protein
MSPGEFKSSLNNPNYRGSVVFSRLDADWTEPFQELDKPADGLQSATASKPYRVQALPKDLEYTTSGPVIKGGSSFNVGNLKQDINFHDWMKTYAQNVKDTLPKGALLPKGTQELLDAPSTEQMNLAATRRLVEVGKEPLEDLRISSMIPVDREGELVYNFTYSDGQERKKYFFRKEGLDPHIETAKKDLPFSLTETKGVGVGDSETLAKIGSQVQSPGSTSTNLLDVAKSLDPRFAENMPQEVADAFAGGQVQRIFRTSQDLAPESLKPGMLPIGNKVNQYGDYGGSIYVQTKDGRTARFKNPELSMGDDAGWNANKGRSVFFENAGIYQDDAAFSQLKQETFQAKGSSLSVNEVNKLRASISTPVARGSSADLIGKNIIEYSSDMTLTHGGHSISDVFESTGKRSFFYQPDAALGTRGQMAEESIAEFMSRKGTVQSAATQPLPQTGTRQIKPTGTQITTQPLPQAGNRPIIAIGSQVSSSQSTAPIASNIPAVQQANARPIIQMGTAAQVPMSVSPMSPMGKTMQKIESLEVSGKIAKNNIPMTVDDGIELTLRRSRSTAKMLGSASQASAAVTKGVSGTGALRAAGAALNLFT